MDTLILGLPLATWVIVPLLGAPIGVLVLFKLEGAYSLNKIWLVGLAFFLARLFIESAYDDGRPDRVFAVMIMWSLYMLMMFGIDWVIRKKFVLP